MPQPSLLGLDAGSLNHLFHCLPLKELLALSQSCKSFYNLITHEGLIWRYQLYRQFGLDLCAVASSTAQQQPLPRDICRLLVETAKQLRPLRFTAVYTDGGVDTGAPHYWCGPLRSVLLRRCQRPCTAVVSLAPALHTLKQPPPSPPCWRPAWICPSTNSTTGFHGHKLKRSPRPSPPMPCRCCC